MPGFPTLLINAFNRPASLQRLLESISRAHVPPNVRLVISIDGDGHPRVPTIAKSFPWPHGPREVITHTQNLGLVKHFLTCGGMTRELGDVIYLEDDLIVSQSFYAFASQALQAYRNDPQIAGISLNNLPLNGYTQMPFVPLPDHGDTFFAQIYWYQGQVYTPQMWDTFETWWHNTREPLTPDKGLHPSLLPHPRWKNDFFPDAIHFLHQTRRFFAFPRVSHAANPGEPGTHFHKTTHAFRTPLHRGRANFHFPATHETLAVYDSYLEILPEKLAPFLTIENFSVDLNGTKLPSAYHPGPVLTTRPSREVIRSFGMTLIPPEANVIERMPGTGIVLAPNDSLIRNPLANQQVAARLARLYNRPPNSIRKLLLHRLALWLDR